MGRPTDAESLVKKLIADGTPDEHRALLDALLGGHVSSILQKLDTSAEPALRLRRRERPGSVCGWTCTARSHRSGGISTCPAT